MEAEVEQALKELLTFKKIHVQVGVKLLEADGGGVHLLDLLAFATMNRSMCLLSGFASMIEAANFVCAAPLLRMQVDNCLRFYASSLVTSPGEFVFKVIQGTPIRKLHDRDGRPMTDAYLCDKLSRHIPWIAKIYETMSGYIHLSEKHHLNAWKKRPEAEQEPGKSHVLYKMKLSDKDEFVETRDYVDTTKYFSETTNILLTLVHRWVVCKDVGGLFEVESLLANPANYTQRE